MAEGRGVSRLLMVCLVLGILTIRATSKITVGEMVHFGKCYSNCIAEYPVVGIFICSKLCDSSSGFVKSVMEIMKEAQSLSSSNLTTTRQHPAAEKVDSSIKGK
ncbi:hypothetical protein V6N11_009733 [Hibiscus sabdariffa]|uniref:Uncharacterized protein n=1 Tax=Hibiscus sabdariffa TaxID=183260 RepID=A0ABR2P675_9ROSI